MPSISNLVRHKRFRVLENSDVHILMGLDNSETTRGRIVDCSINGLFVELTSESEYLWNDSTIVPNAKIVAGEEETPIGRLAVRRIIRKSDTQVFIAFSTIDNRVPVGGSLSKHLEVHLDDSNGEFEMELSEKGFTLADFLTSNNDNIDIFDRCEKFTVFWKQLSRSNKFTYYYPRSSKSGARIKVRHSSIGNETSFLMFGSNDYLGLSSHPEVVEAMISATQQYGVGSTGTAPTAGTTVLHAELCNKIATMHNQTEALVFPSGYAANLGIIGGLARPGDLIVADNISHASLQDGMKLSGATYRFFKHNNMEHLKSVLEQNRGKYSGCLIVTEGMFSMNGELGKLDQIVPIAKKYNSRTMVDQGHCFGLLGKTFTGTAEHLGVGESIDISMGLFSKGLGTLGGFVTGPKSLMDWYKGYARSLMFATSFPPGIAAATLKSLEIIETGSLQEKLNYNIRFFVDGLVKMGVPINPNHGTPVIPIPVWDEIKMGAIAQHLNENGIFALPVIYPVVARDKCQFRFSLTANFNESDLALTLKVLEEAFRRVNMDFSSMTDANQRKQRLSA